MSLFEEIFKYCDEKYKNGKCKACNHPSGTCKCNDEKCEYTCAYCLEDIHHGKEKYRRKEYNCERLTYFYVGRYLPKYVSEMSYLIENSLSPQENDNLNILSVGCGPCSELMAFENLGFDVNKYIGIDYNKTWANIHNKIKEVINKSTQDNDKIKYYYDDFINLEIEDFKDVNVLVLNYVLSSFEHSDNTRILKNFIPKIKELIEKKTSSPFYILINDIEQEWGSNLYANDLLDELGINENDVFFYRFNGPSSEECCDREYKRILHERNLFHGEVYKILKKFYQKKDYFNDDNFKIYHKSINPDNGCKVQTYSKYCKSFQYYTKIE